VDTADAPSPLADSCRAPNCRSGAHTLATSTLPWPGPLQHLTICCKLIGMARRTKAPLPADKAVGYCRCSTDEQSASGLGLAAQRRAIKLAAEARGLTLVSIEVDEGVSGTKTERAGLQAALGRIESREVGVLIAAKQDRLSRSLLHLAGLLERSAREQWRLIFADTAVDTGTDSGMLLAGIMGSVAAWERQRIANRTREALAAKKAQGARLGRPVTLPDTVRRRIAKERARGRTLMAIGERLTAEGVPTSQGGTRWYPSTVASVLRSLDLDAESRAAS
jgi:DNA invertase Pin-like site-specific DNA recombinase